MLSTKFCNIEFKNPILAASGTFGFGDDYKDYMDIEKLGGFATTGITINPKSGNSGIRIHEVTGGMLNSIGLENDGVKDYITNINPRLENLNTNILVNLGGNTFEEYIEGAKLLEESNIKIMELNISCPNVKCGGMAFGLDPKLAFDLVKKVREVYTGILVVKLSPNGDVKEVAKAVEKAGADAISLINTITGLAIDIDNKKPVFDNIIAGLSGPCIKPIALRMVYEVSKIVDIPIIGIGGIRNYKDVLEFIMAGATLVQIGSMNFIKPDITIDIINDLEEYMITNNISSFDEIRGII
ncbi:MAG TPA: dihydroorotate dehydrogenase [Tissierellaceae bacterium]